MSRKSPRAVSANETRKCLRVTTAYGRYCAEKDPEVTFKESMNADLLHGFERVQEVFDAYFLLTRGAFEAAWRKGVNEVRGSETLF